MKSLEIVQKFFKVFKVLSKIAMIFCIVISCIWVVSLICALFYTDITTLNKVFMVQNMNTSTLWVSCLCGMILSITYGILSYYSYKYCEKEVNDGTPFTHEGAKMIRQLAIKSIWMPIVSYIVCEIFITLYEIQYYDFEAWFSIGWIVFLFLMAAIFDYGADLKEQSN